MSWGWALTLELLSYLNDPVIFKCAKPEPSWSKNKCCWGFVFGVTIPLPMAQWELLLVLAELSVLLGWAELELGGAFSAWEGEKI